MANNIDFPSYDYLYENEIRADVILDSVSDITGARATTFLLRLPRIILAEVNTHRKFSRNAASSRAKRFSTLLKDTDFHPKLWLENHKGMQASDLLPTWKSWIADALWSSSRLSAIMHGWLLDQLGVSKQYSNRIIEPYSYINYLVTSTEWDNFLRQRDDNGAQFEMQVLARKIKESLKNSLPTILYNNEWHLPFIKPDEMYYGLYDLIRISAARSARTSYGDNFTKAGIEAEFQLYKKLIHANPPHLSPVEHQLIVRNVESSGNIDGFIQFRKLIEVCNFNSDKIKESIHVL